jgi:hypothetical protein
VLLTDFELERKLLRAASVERDPRWGELYDLASVLAVLGALDEALTLWRFLYGSDIPLPKPLDISIHGDLVVSAVCHQLEAPDLSGGHPQPKYIRPGAPLAKRVEAHDYQVRVNLTQDRWLPEEQLRQDLPHMSTLRTHRQALRLAYPGRDRLYSPTEAEALPLLQEFLDTADLDAPSPNPMQDPYSLLSAGLLAADIAARHEDEEEAVRRLRDWYDLGVRFPGNCVPEYAFGLRAVAGLICRGVLADKTSLPRQRLGELVREIMEAPAQRAGRPPARPPSIEELPGFLERIFRKLEELEKPAARLLQPGLTRERIDALTRDLPFKLPEEACWLYMWRNGTAEDTGATLGDMTLFDSKHMLSLEDALGHHHSLPMTPEHYGDYYEPDLVEALHGATLFPLFSDDCAGYYYIACGAEAALTGLMVDDFGDGIEPRLAFQSLTRMMGVLADLYDAGVEDPFLEDEDSP